MAYTYKSDGIILKRWNYKDQDKMVRLLTRDYGKLTTRAISARKITSKLAGHLEPFIYADFFIARSRTIDIVAGSNTLAPHTQLRESLPHAAVANFFSEIIDRFTQEQEKDAALFEHVHGFYAWLNNSTPHLLGLYAAIIQLLSILGFRLELYTCHACNNPITPEGTKFNFKLWSVECVNCKSSDETMFIHENTIKALRFIHEHSLEESTKLHIPIAQWQEFTQLIHALLRYHLDTPLKSETILFTLLQPL